MRLHPDLDELVLHALGEPVLDRLGLEHVAGCPDCSGTVAGLTGTVRAVRGTEDRSGPVVPPPAHVWQGVSAELGLDPAVRPSSVGPTRLPHGPRPDVDPGQDAVTDPHHADVVAPGRSGPTRDGRRRVGARVLAVAAAGLVVGGGGAALLVPRLTGPATPAPAVLAAADLEAFGAGEGTDVAGTARLAATSGSTEASGSTGSTGTGGSSGTGGTGGSSAGDRVLELRLDGLPDTGDGFFEAWLIDPVTGAMVSLGPVSTDGPATELSVPRGVDVGTYAVVDVSAEPRDGDPTHSGVSLVRGTLDT